MPAEAVGENCDAKRGQGLQSSLLLGIGSALHLNNFAAGSFINKLMFI